MRVPLSWLSDFVELDVPAQKLKDLLDLSGTKVEAVHRPATGIDGIVVAEVVAVQEHPNADTLTLVDVRTGVGEQRVVCGARNIGPGDKVPLAQVGSRLPCMEITERKIRGETSSGMLCSAAELGVSKDHAGILVLPQDAPIGNDVVGVLGLDDTILELEVTPNRGDCLGIIGVAREVAALLHKELRIPPVAVPSHPGVVNPARVVLEDTEGCPRFWCGFARGIEVGPSPSWMAARLVAAGIRPISNVVDITNYVMVETGHPVHAYDAAGVAAATFVVRRAREGERLRTLDGTERELDVEDLLICDAERPLGLAGVMGGEDSEISDATSEILVEVAHFDPTSITKTSRRHNLRSEASVRFERGADPEAVSVVGRRVLQLLEKVCGAEIGEDAVDERGADVAPTTLYLRPTRTDALLGFETPPTEQVNILRQLGFTVREEERLSVTAPSWRSDIEREVDLIEEIARIAGFDRLPDTIPPGRAGGLTPAQAMVRDLRRALTGMGLHEAWTSSMISVRDLDLLGLPEEHPARAVVRLSNPMTEDEAVMRTSLLPGLLRATARNVAHRAENVALYEIARTYEPAEPDPLPRESLVLGGTFTGHKIPRSWNAGDDRWEFFAVKGVLEAAFDSLRLDAPGFQPVSGMPFHPTRAALVSLGSQPLGIVGEIHPQVCETYAVPEGTVALELALESVLSQGRTRATVEELPRYPAAYMDLALVVDEGVPARRVGELVRAAGAPEVTEARLFDVYRGEQVPEGKKSLAYSLELRAPDRTLTDEDATDVRDRILTALEERTGAVLRT